MLPRDLRKASFRGASFLCPEDDLEAGRNAIDHSYPDASHRYMEDNGYILPRFHVQAIVSEPNLQGKLRALMGALDRPGPGTLKHPWYGSRLVMVDGTYSVRRSDRHAGYVEIDIPFAVTGGAIFPGLISGIAAVVSGIAGSIVAGVLATFVSNYKTPRSTTSRTVLTERIAEVGTALDTSFGASSDAGARIAIDAGAIAIEPDKLAALAEEAFDAPFVQADYTNAQMISICRGLVDLGQSWSEEAAAIDPTTVDLIDRRDSLNALACVMTVCSFARLCDAVSTMSYDTSEQIQVDESRLVEIYGEITGNEDINVGLDEDTVENLKHILVETSEVLRGAEVRLPRVGDLNVINTPASVLSYSLYASDEQLPLLVGLNLDQNPILLTGSVKVLEEQS